MQCHEGRLYATGDMYGANEHLPQTGGLVTFAPGARSAWHTHPGGQILIVASGTGWVQEEGGAKREIKPGDVIWTPPGMKHWHGATATTSMSHARRQERRMDGTGQRRAVPPVMEASPCG